MDESRNSRHRETPMISKTVEAMIRAAFSKRKRKTLAAFPEFREAASKVSTFEDFHRLCDLAAELVRKKTHLHF